MSGSKGQEIVNTWMESEDLTKADLARTINAALRAAKVDGLNSARKLIQNRLIDLRQSRSTCRLSFLTDAYDAQIEELDSLSARIAELERES